MTTREEILKKIHLGIDPFVGFPAGDWKTDPHGWDSEHHFFHEAIELIRPRIIVEVGTFLGGSARHMAIKLRELNLDSVVVCVDTWLAEHILWHDMVWRPKLVHRFGRPEFYNTFMANTIQAGLQNYIVPLPMSSVSASRYLKKLSIKPQLVYVDGCHEEGDAYNDLSKYYDLLEVGGMMVVDDYDPGAEMFHGLVRDIHKFSKDIGRGFKISGRKALFKKMNQH